MTTTVRRPPSARRSIGPAPEPECGTPSRTGVTQPAPAPGCVTSSRTGVTRSAPEGCRAASWSRRSETAIAGRGSRLFFGLPVGLLLAAACAHSAFDQQLERGHVEEAIRIFDADSTLARDPDNLFRAATARATPGSPVYDPDLARAELQLLIQRFPNSSHRLEARRLDALLGEVLRASTNVARLSARIDSLTERQDSLIQYGYEQHRMAAQLQVDLRRTQAELNQVQQELERLKAIDLQLSGRRRPDR